jgi:hypothetical protein
MRHAESKPGSAPSETKSPEGAAAHAVPTLIATDLLEKLIIDRDAIAVRNIVTEGRRH